MATTSAATTKARVTIEMMRLIGATSFRGRDDHPAVFNNDAKCEG
jgi:hypothetical protein